MLFTGSPTPKGAFGEKAPKTLVCAPRPFPIKMTQGIYLKYGNKNPFPKKLFLGR